MSLLCKCARDFEINKITAVKIMRHVDQGFGNEYREFCFCSFLMPRMCSFGDIKCIEMILVYKTSMKPCGFDSVYSDRQP